MDKFIEASKIKHGDKYDYSKVDYKNNLTEVTITCLSCNSSFNQLPKVHKRGGGCTDCSKKLNGLSRRGDTKSFIDKATSIHKDKYDYSKVVYIKANEKVIIVCKTHGDFKITPNSHLDGAGCRKCSTIKNTDKLRKTKEQFIEEAIIKHTYKFDYSKVVYVNYHSKIIIICKDHGVFQQTPGKHLSGIGCVKCANASRAKNKTKTTLQFIEEATSIHGNTFDYSKTIYEKCDENIIIICKKHGEFQQTPGKHLVSKICCHLCLLNEIGKWNSSNTNTFIEASNKIHGDKYDYSKVNYIKAIEKVIIVCKTHGDFDITPNSHLNGSGCYHCGKISMKQKQTLTKEEFIKKSIEVHGNIYDYSKVDYVNNCTVVIIICKKHSVFEQTPQGHLSGRGCIKCSCKYQYTTEEWIIMAKKVHDDKYDYSKCKYISGNVNLTIICKTHGDFEQLPRVHLRPADCFRCSHKSFSKKQIQWLEIISKMKGINIQHALNENEYKIPNTTFKSDGYCKETNTLYEFHGDFWHGNPKIYSGEKINPKNKKTFGELYQSTMIREQKLKSLGYNLVVMWEYDWNKINKYVRFLQRIFRTHILMSKYKE